ncbi:hypothetical protein M8C13_08850 [Crossiella sp. SN42]|uniref:hypothetical protein n=1 Tax=Crossiella sp. SN42 TaxID=2944808 RepID=UPI00207D6D05|nr:hypothetical protein [Crossiella sp. SN42]MCO1575864.1 hypothetical protein [Crossiella sp. SN42]
MIDDLEASLARSRAVLAEAEARAERVIAESQAEDARYRDKARASATEMLAQVEAAQRKPAPTPTSPEPEEMRLYDTSDDTLAPVRPTVPLEPRPRSVPPRRGRADEDEDFSEIDWMNG